MSVVTRRSGLLEPRNKTRTSKQVKIKSTHASASPRRFSLIRAPRFLQITKQRSKISAKLNFRPGWTRASTKTSPTLHHATSWGADC